MLKLTIKPSRQVSICVRSLLLVSAMVWLLSDPCRAESDGRPLRLTLPAECYAVPGVEMSLYFDNIVLTETPDSYRFKVSCNVGRSDQKRWWVMPAQADVGEHPLTVSVTNGEGKVLEKASLLLRVMSADAGAKRNIRLLFVGDSLTHATHYPNEIAELLSQPGNPGWTMLGTHKPSGAKPGVAHEGYGGWTWKRFAVHYEPNPDGTYRKRSSPFVYLDENEKPQLNLRRYFLEECSGKPADFVVFKLGINDCFGLNPDDARSLDAGIDAVFVHADVLLAAFREEAPQAKFGICLTTPPNARESAFQANYQGKYPRWGWKRIQHRLVQRQLEHFGNREKEHIYIVPTQLNLDPVDGYPTNNGVHPNQQGYKQIGASIYSWLKAEMESDESQR